MVKFICNLILYWRFKLAQRHTIRSKPQDLAHSPAMASETAPH